MRRGWTAAYGRSAILAPRRAANQGADDAVDGDSGMARPGDPLPTRAVRSGMRPPAGPVRCLRQPVIATDPNRPVLAPRLDTSAQGNQGFQPAVHHAITQSAILPIARRQSLRGPAARKTRSRPSVDAAAQYWTTSLAGIHSKANFRGFRCDAFSFSIKRQSFAIQIVLITDQFSTTSTRAAAGVPGKAVCAPSADNLHLRIL